jgi:hypothetical protein
MTNRTETMMIIAGLGLSCATLAGCVSEVGSYETRQPSVYRERVVIEQRGDYRQRRGPDYDRRSGRDRDRDCMDRDRNRDWSDGQGARRPRDDRRRCVAPNCVDPTDEARPIDSRRPHRVGDMN